MQDIDILRYFLDAKAFKYNYHALPKDMFEADVLNMLLWFDHYFKRYPEDKFISIDKLNLLMKLDKSVNKDAYDLTKSILDNLRVPIDLNVRANLMESLEERRLAGEIALLVKRFNDGDEVDLSTEIYNKTLESRNRRKIKHQGVWEDGDVWQMVQESADTAGYLFTFLPQSVYGQLVGVNEGDNIAVAAPTNAGKTSFLVRCAVEFAKQRKVRMETEASNMLPEGLASEDKEPMKFRPVLYLVNESNARKITPRVYQTALNINRERMFDLGSKGKLEEAYIGKMGRRDAIRLVNIHGLTLADVVKIIDAHDPFLVITDMTGRIRADSKTNMNETSQLEMIWNSMREYAEIMNFIHIGTVQLSKEGFDTLYPTLDAVQGSKVGIQTTWDLSFFLGAMLQPAEGSEGVRGISTPKSKRARFGANDYIKQVTNFNAEYNTWCPDQHKELIGNPL